MGSSSKQVVGYKYYIGLHLVSAVELDELTAILMGDRIVWEGSVTTNTTLNIDVPDLFGGEDAEGGVVGDIDVMFGGDTQGTNAYLQNVLGGVVPAFRGVFSLVFNQVYMTAMARTPKPVWVQGKRIGAKGWYDAKAEIPGNGVDGDADYIPADSMNYAHCIYEIITNTDWGMGKDPSFIDDTNFMASADTLYDENLGASFQITSSISMKDLAQELLTTISGILYTDRETGKYKLKLIREPTTTELDAALVFDNSTVLSFERPSFSEMVNEVVVKFKRQSDGADGSVSAHDLGSISSRGEIISQNITMIGVDNSTIASRIAEREVRNYATPLAKIKIKVDRTGSSINPGDIIKFSSEEHSISNMIVRIFSVDYGVLTNGYVTLEGVEDIFSMPSTSYLSSGVSQWSDPVQPAVDITDKYVIEAPYWEVYRQFDEASFLLLSNTSAFLQYVAKENLGTSNYSYQVHTDVGSGYTNIGDGEFSPAATIQNLLTRVAELEIPIDNIDFRSEEITINGYAYIDQEAIQITAVDTVLGTMSIKRGVLDTIPVEHAAGSLIYFTQDNDGFMDTEYSIAETIDAKALAKTGEGVLSIASTAADQITFTGRFAKPYPPCRVTFNGSYFPEYINGDTDTTVGWYYQSKTSEGIQGPSSNWYEAGSNPEASTEIELLFYDESDSLFSTVEISANTLVTNEAYALTVATEKGLSSLYAGDSGRVLVSSSMGISSNVARTEIAGSTLNDQRDESFSRIGPDWGTVLFYPPSNVFESHFVYGATGVRHSYIGTTSNINDFVQRSDNQWGLNTNLAYTDSSGLSGGLESSWRVVGSTIPSPNPNPATDIVLSNEKRTVFLESIIDHRENPGTHQIFIGYERSNHLRFLPPNDGINQQKNLILSNVRCYMWNYSGYFNNQFNPQFTEFDVEHQFIADSTLLDSINDYHWPLTSNQNGVHSDLYSSVMDLQILGSYACGGLVYISYVGGDDTNTWETSTKNLDITNILDSHRTVSSFKTPKTKVMSLSGSTMAEVYETSDIIFAARSNVADTELVEWHSKFGTFQILNSTTRASISGPFNAAFKPIHMTCDWVAGYIYMIRQDWDTVYKFNMTGVQQSSIALPSGPQLGVEGRLSVGLNYLYVTDKSQNTYYIDKDLVGPWVRAPFKITAKGTTSAGEQNFDCRPDSSQVAFHDSDIGYDLYDETGGSVSAGNTEKRLNSTLKIEVKSKLSGLDSHQTLTHTITRDGYGYRYGSKYGE